METNYFAILGAAFIPMIMGFLWYGPMLFQKAWMKEMNFTQKDVEGGNMLVIFGLSFVFSFILALFLQSIVIHQFGVFQTLAGEPGFMEQTGEGFATYKEFMANYGNRFRTFKHGALHGVLSGLFIVLPVIGTKALFERKTFKYIAINVGYWMITLALMGGVVCQWA
ncbi:Protein of unknown function [Tenacibaculum sp. MAR_2009_124]|uniref:DUF1761 domain-containing protein n=1 Tax=Tenacibaculum sp. MAR_2009_124 TaxID=1250059 RepID=UPI000898B6AE|nr:DUF1761 domain-containing protein [Tenacibaculum sp. MAR_2009_124]SEC36250.1 Protein of unknown function [Tenacibaculum sp. MAR_2009_124]